MSTNITEFSKYIHTDVLPCPAPILEREILNTIIEFCASTNILTQEFNHEFDVDSDGDTELDDEYQNCVDIDLGEYAANRRIITVLAFNLDGLHKYPEYREILNTIPDTQWEMLHDDDVIYFSFPNNNTLRVYDRETSDSNLYIVLALKPERDVTKVDEFFLEDWLDTICAGVKYRILSMPNKEWTNKAAARENWIQWKRGLSKAKAKVRKKFTKTALEVQPRSFGEIDWEA